MGNLRSSSDQHERQKSEFFCTKMSVFGTKSRTGMIRSALESPKCVLNAQKHGETLKMVCSKKDGWEVHVIFNFLSFFCNYFPFWSQKFLKIDLQPSFRDFRFISIREWIHDPQPSLKRPYIFYDMKKASVLEKMAVQVTLVVFKGDIYTNKAIPSHLFSQLILLGFLSIKNRKI